MPVVGRHMLSEEVDLPLHTDALACVPKRCKSLKINSIDGIRAAPPIGHDAASAWCAGRWAGSNAAPREWQRPEAFRRQRAPYPAHPGDCADGFSGASPKQDFMVRLLWAFRGARLVAVTFGTGQSHLFNLSITTTPRSIAFASATAWFRRL